MHIVLLQLPPGTAWLQGLRSASAGSAAAAAVAPAGEEAATEGNSTDPDPLLQCISDPAAITRQMSSMRTSGTTQNTSDFLLQQVGEI